MFRARDQQPAAEKCRSTWESYGWDINSRFMLASDCSEARDAGQLHQARYRETGFGYDINIYLSVENIEC